MYMQGLANFIDDFLGGLILISFAMVIGGIVWSVFVLKCWGSAKADPTLAKRSAKIIRNSAIGLVVMQGLKLLIKGLVLFGVLGELPILDYISTVQFKAGFIRLILALVVIQQSSALVRNPSCPKTWIRLSVVSIPLVLAGAWLVHAVGRFDDRLTLMGLTVLHQFAAAIWFGGVAQLVSLWQLSRNNEAAKDFWRTALLRFAKLGVIAVIALLITGLPLAYKYVASWTGLFGTGYGSLVLTKSALLLIAVGFAAANHLAVKRSKNLRQGDLIYTKVPSFIEAESFILIGILFVAATLSSQPPSEDIADNPQLTASIPEVVYMFTPRVPKIESPSHADLIAGEAGRVAVVNKIPSVAAKEWSDYNHNVAGIFLTVMCIFALISYIPSRAVGWANYWPIGFVGLGVFLFFRSDAETWPLGPIGFWESTFKNGEVFQHRIATLLTLILGILEIRARTGIGSPRSRYLFPILCAFGGILLLTHAHAEFELKTEYLIQSTHVTMGLLAMIIASGRWLELRLTHYQPGYHSAWGDDGIGSLSGIVSILAMLMIGVIMMFYLEPLV